MKGRLAAEKLMANACKSHAFDCHCVRHGKAVDSLVCSCGATEHNNEMGICLIQLVDAVRDGEYLKTVDIPIGVECPTYKFT